MECKKRLARFVSFVDSGMAPRAWLLDHSVKTMFFGTRKQLLVCSLLTVPLVFFMTLYAYKVDKIIPLQSHQESTNGSNTVLQFEVKSTVVNSTVQKDSKVEFVTAALKKWNVFDGRSDKYTIIMLTYERMDFLETLLKHYSSTPEVDQILVVWNNIGMLPPVNISKQLGPHSAPVRFLVQKENKVRNRLQPFKEIQTSAVFLVDDDLHIPKVDLRFAFHTWKDFPQRLVGFFARSHTAKFGTYEYNFPRWERGSLVYSMVLTGACFIHKNYLKMFNESVPREVHEMIDSYQNCEDIAMNWMIANYLYQLGMPQPCGLYIKPIQKIMPMSRESRKGLFFDPNHVAERGKCITRMVEIYQGFVVPYTETLTSPIHK